LEKIVRTIRITPYKEGYDDLVGREWLVTNGLGGYASGTLSGALTRRYHALLVASLHAPLGRVVLLNYLIEHITRSNGSKFCLGAEHGKGKDIIVHGAAHLADFRLEQGIPVWSYNIGDIKLEKRIFMPHMQNSVHINYNCISSNEDFSLDLRPSLQFRPHEDPLTEKMSDSYTFTAESNHYEIKSNASSPVLRLYVASGNGCFVLDGGTTHDVHYHLEEERGYEAQAKLWTPGYIRAQLGQGKSFTLVASCENWETILAMTPEEAFTALMKRKEHILEMSSHYITGQLGRELVFAADQFIISPSQRAADTVRTHASGDEVQSVIAGYHWFTDWGRDTMISLEGLTLVTGRHAEAGWILRTFAHYVKDGLIPNLFPEGKNEGLYNTADATLWFFHALHRYLIYTNDKTTLNLLLDTLVGIVHHHLNGTRFGIKVDPADHLLCQGQEHYQLTWMDAKVDNWVVTPRRGKAVEINALWYNALRLLEKWLGQVRGEHAGKDMRELADRVYESFNKKFWNQEKGYLFDVIDGEKGNDSACRPNQLFAISLDYPVLDKSKWEPVLNVVTEKLLTPFGLRSLSPDHPDYKSRYYGDLKSRDAAYHQGTVWAWLIGPYISAWVKLYPERKQEATKFLEGFGSHLDEACIGSVSEIFDAESPYKPRGCIAQAWSVAEILRCIGLIDNKIR
jgi:predicted glycogen debranching enzyme